MDKRYQVFVSSTFEDLQEERREVMQALLSLDCIPTGMELFPAADDDSWGLIKRFIAGCDYYVVILGGRYGSVGADGKSYTEMEYDYAVEAGLPVLAFLHGDPGKIVAEKTEETSDGKAALKNFRKKIEAGRHAKFWTSPKDLALAVFQSMSSLMKTKPRTGWIRADQATTEGAAREILDLRNKVDELNTYIAESELTPPQGTEMLAQGDETISLHFRYEQFNGSFADEGMAFSWNEILSVLGPILIVQATESNLKDALGGAFASRFKDKFHMQVYHQYVREEEFQQVKLQLRALGLIRELKDESSTGGDSTAWTLTPYGDRVMTQVAAIRSSAKA